MATHGQRLRAALESGDLEQLVALLDERVVWRGLPGSDYGRRGDTRILADDHYHAPDHRGDHEEGGHDYEQVPLCTGREEVRAILEGFLAPGGTGPPAIVAEAGDSLVVDPRVQPTLPFPLHQALTFRGGRIVLIQDYADRATAVADLRR